MNRVSRTRVAGGWFGITCSLPVAFLLVGCAPEGAGTIKISDPQAVRAKGEGGPSAEKSATEKPSKALELEEEAAKKHAKLK